MLEADVRKQLRDFSLDVSFEVQRGKILILMGENGAGKSTALNILSGLVSPDTGSIRLNNTTLFESGQGIRLPAEDRNIGYVLQNSAAFPHLTAADNIAYGMKAHHIQKDQIPERVEYWLKMMDIHNLARVRAADLSGGQRQRVAIGRALAIEPQLLLLDEPFTALDRDGVHIVKDLIRKQVTERRIPCIIVTHRLSDSREIADRACVICNGKVQWTGTPNSIPEMYCAAP